VVDDSVPGPESARPTNVWWIPCLAVNLLGFAGLILMTVAAKEVHLAHDEGWYLETATTLRAEGLSVDYVRELPGVAGPLYPFVHVLFAPLTGLHQPGIRLVNAALFAISTVFIGLLFRLRRLDHPFASSWHLMATPMVYGVVGVALTDVPALLCFYASVPLLLMAVSPPAPGRPARAVTPYALASLAGLCFGLAVIGRQQYLAALGALPLLALSSRAAWPVLIAYGAAALPLPAVVFAIWGGLVPPKTQYVEHGITIVHGMLSFGYAGVAYTIYDPRFLIRPRYLALIATSIVLHMYFRYSEVLPSIVIVTHHLPSSLVPYYAPAGSGLIIGLGCCIFAELWRIGLTSGDDHQLRYLCAIAFLLLLTPLRINHLFSSRYMIPALPLLLLIAESRAKDSFGKSLRMGAGCVLGLLSFKA
jgi:hypothetical protein